MQKERLSGKAIPPLGLEPTSRSRPPSLGESPDPARSGLRPIVWWAGVGVLFVVVQVVVYANWLIQGDAYRQAMGPDGMGTGAKVVAWLLQGSSLAALIAVVVYLVRRSRREGHLCWDAFIPIAFLTCFWQDTMCNYLRPVFFYNSYLVNFGAWNPHIPGWISPHARNTPEPVLLSGPLWGWWILLFAMAFCGLARQTQKFFPQMGRVGLFGFGVVVLGLLDLVVELVAIRTGLFAYPGVIRELSIWGGTRYQFPLYESLIAGVFCSIVGVLRLGRDDKGRSVVERGLERVSLTGGKATALRALAWIGLANTMFLTLNVVYNWIGLYADPTPKFPSYLTNGICGPGTGVDCPGPAVAIPLPRTPLSTKSP